MATITYGTFVKGGRFKAKEKICDFLGQSVVYIDREPSRLDFPDSDALFFLGQPSGIMIVGDKVRSYGPNVNTQHHDKSLCNAVFRVEGDTVSLYVHCTSAKVYVRITNILVGKKRKNS